MDDGRFLREYDPGMEYVPGAGWDTERLIRDWDAVRRELRTKHIPPPPPLKLKQPPQKPAAPRHYFREPADKESLGYAVWLILGGEKTDVHAAARLLQIDHSDLSRFLRGKKTLPPHYIRKRAWPTLLEKHFSEGWKNHQGLFDERFRKLSMPDVPESIEAPTADNAGYFLRLIIGGKHACIKEAAGILEINRTSLGEMLGGKWPVSMHHLIKHGWRTKLAHHYTEGWKNYGAAFDIALMLRQEEKQLPFSQKRWCYIADTFIKRMRNQQRKISRRAERTCRIQLRVNLAGAQEKRAEEKRNLRARRRQPNWLKGTKRFIRTMRRDMRFYESLVTNWRETAGEALQRKRLSLRLAITDVLPHVQIEALKQKEIWMKIENGRCRDKNAIASAFAEFCRIYELDRPTAPKFHARATRFMALCA